MLFNDFVEPKLQAQRLFGIDIPHHARDSSWPATGVAKRPAEKRGAYLRASADEIFRLLRSQKVALTFTGFEIKLFERFSLDTVRDLVVIQHRLLRSSYRSPEVGNPISVPFRLASNFVY